MRKRILFHSADGYNENTVKLLQKLHYMKRERQRRARFKYPSPAELRFVEIMGGRTLRLNFLKHRRTGYPRAWMFMGKYLRREFVEREKRVGAMYLDFAFVTPWAMKGVEIDGKNFHRDVVREQNRDDYLRGYGWRILHVPAEDLWRRPDKVRTRVHEFLKS